MAYTPYKMKGPSLYKKLSKKPPETFDTNKDGVISGADFPLKKRKCKKNLEEQISFRIFMYNMRI